MTSASIVRVEPTIPESVDRRWVQPHRERRLSRSSTDYLAAGVLGGIAELYRINPIYVRAVFIASFIIPGPQLLLYLVAWMILPRVSESTEQGKTNEDTHWMKHQALTYTKKQQICMNAEGDRS